MMAKLVDGQASVYAEPDQTSSVIADLSHGEELQITGPLTSGGDDWLAVALPDERRGYLPRGTRLERCPIVELAGDAAMRVEPSQTSPVLVTHGSGARLWLLGTVMQEERRWLKVRDADGHTGFLPEGTRLEDRGPRSAAQAQIADQAQIAYQVHIARAKRNMLVGGLWCGGGLAVTLFTYAAASGGGTYVVAWGAIIFGGWQFLKGLAQYSGGGDS